MKPGGSGNRKRAPGIATAFTTALAVALGSCGPLRPSRVPAGPRIFPASRAERPWFRTSTYRLENGLTVVLLEDHEAPHVVVDLHMAVGLRDEGAGERGLARLAARQLLCRDPLADGALAERLERAASESVSTGLDATQYVALGPPALLEALLRRAARRLADEPIDAPLARSGPDLPASSADTAAAAESLLDSLVVQALFPGGHPYHDCLTVTGDDAASVSEPLERFLQRFYAPSNATLVVAGDLESAAVRGWIADTFAALGTRPAPERRSAPATAVTRAERLEVAGAESCELVLAWPAPAAFTAGEAELELLASILAEGADSRLEQRIVLGRPIAEEVEASLVAAELGSVFRIRARAAPEADLDEVAREILAEVEALASEGPSAAELARARGRLEGRFRQRMRGLLARAEAIQAYQRAFGVADAFQRDLERRTRPTAEDLRARARELLGTPPVDLRLRRAEPPVLDAGHRNARAPEAAALNRSP